MKKVISFLAIAVFSSTALAARIPTLAEFDKYMAQIEGVSSVASITKDIKTGKLNPIIEFTRTDGKEEIVSIPGRSSFASSLIFHRFDARKPIGNEKENLELLDVIIKAGVDVNAIQTDNGNFQKNTLMDVAATTCSPSAINLLIKNGADPSLEDFYWVKAFNSSFNEDLDTQYSKNCLAVSDFLSGKAKEVGLFSISQLFYPLLDNDDGVGSFTEGATMDERFTPNMKFSLENLGVKLSLKPEGEAPSDAWWKEFVAVMGSAIGQDYRDYGLKWWNKQSDTEKAWACYYSSFDEALTAFHNLDISDETLTTKSIGGNYTMRIINKFPVFVFGPYCNSLK